MGLVIVDRLILMPAELRIALAEPLELRRQGWGSHGSGQYPQRSAPSCCPVRQPLLYGFQEALPGGGQPLMSNQRGAFRVPEFEHRRLSEYVGRTATRRMPGIPLQFHRPAHVAGGDHAAGVAVE
jgi:hypothetical protein